MSLHGARERLLPPFERAVPVDDVVLVMSSNLQGAPVMWGFVPRP